jgi:hypothetical protein
MNVGAEETIEAEACAGCEEEKEATNAQEKSPRLLAGRTAAARIDRAAAVKALTRS